MAGFYTAALSKSQALHWPGLSPPSTVDLALAQGPGAKIPKLDINRVRLAHPEVVDIDQPRLSGTHADPIARCDLGNRFHIGDE